MHQLLTEVSRLGKDIKQSSKYHLSLSFMNMIIYWYWLIRLGRKNRCKLMQQWPKHIWSWRRMMTHKVIYSLTTIWPKRWKRIMLHQMQPTTWHNLIRTKVMSRSHWSSISNTSTVLRMKSQKQKKDRLWIVQELHWE